VSYTQVEDISFDRIYDILWERISNDTIHYKRKPARAVVKDEPEKQRYAVYLHAPKRHFIAGTTVPLTKADTYNEILRQHGLV